MKDEFSAYLAAFIDELVRSGVSQFVISPGSRSTPLALLITTHPQCQVWMHVDERSAGFFALGIAKASQQPVVLLCTSGTAAANYTPAVIEAYYSRLPLLVLTADRPRESREVGAAQTINQVNLFGHHVKWFNDMPTPESDARMINYASFTANRAVAEAMSVPCGPVHLNFPLREPLVSDLTIYEQDWWQESRLRGLSSVGAPPKTINSGQIEGTKQEENLHSVRSSGSSSKTIDLAQDEEANQTDSLSPVDPSGSPYVSVWEGQRQLDEQMIKQVADVLASKRKGLIVCGPLDDPLFAEAVTSLSAQLGYPIIADPLSQLRSGSHELGAIIDAYDGFLRDERAVDMLVPEVIIRFGAMPVSKALQLYLERHAHCMHIIVDQHLGWRDPILLATDHIVAEASGFCHALSTYFASNGHARDLEWLTLWQNINHTTSQVLAQHADDGVLFEGRLFVELQQALPAGTALFVGNSMPIRDLDTFYAKDDKGVRMLANRGANGIDGLVSTALGISTRQQPVVAVFGDLSFYHDMNGLLVAKQYQLNLTIIIVNNDGGGIFSFLPQAKLSEEYFEPLFGTPTQLTYEHAAAMYGANYSLVHSWTQFNTVMREALDRQGLNIIEVPSERSSNVTLHREFWHAISESLTRVIGD